MKILLRVLGALVVGVLLSSLGMAAYLYLAYPKVSPAPDLTVEATPERLARGAYLAEHVLACMGCHSQRRMDAFSYPPVEGLEGAGGFQFGPEGGVPGTVYSRNLTPYNLHDWTDGEIFRAITAGVAKDGEPLFPIMPSAGYGTLDEEDILSVIAYLRTLPAIANDVPATRIDFPVSLIARTFPKDPSFRPRPDPADTIATGEYLTDAAGCRDCHTDMEGSRPVGPPFAGGREFPYPGYGLFRTANITGDVETGIGGWTRDDFVALFRSRGLDAVRAIDVAPGEPNTVMGWWEYAGMTQADLGAIYDYLMSVEPVRNDVVTFTPLPAE